MRDIKIPSHTACKLQVQIAVNRLTVAGKPPELDVPFAPLIGLSKAALPASNITQHSQEALAGVGGRPQGICVDAPRVFHNCRTRQGTGMGKFQGLSTRTAAYLNSGILPTGSSAALVSTLALASI